MADITLLRGRDKTEIIGNTDKGKTWILENMFVPTKNKSCLSVTCSVDTDSVQDTINAMTHDGLEVQ
jgi:hypothetical protein